MLRSHIIAPLQCLPLERPRPSCITPLLQSAKDTWEKAIQIILCDERNSPILLVNPSQTSPVRGSHQENNPETWAAREGGLDLAHPVSIYAFQYLVNVW
jgi:hypothetical protein